MTNPIISKLEAMTSGEVYEVLLGLKDKLDDASDTVFTFGLDVLAGKVNEDKFNELLENL